MPSVVTINQIFRPSPRFMRSVQLERDFSDSHALEGYVLTDHIQESFIRIAAGLRSDSGQRAWRVTGNYGAGKSIFALLLAHWFAGENGRLPPSLRTALSYKAITRKKPHLLPILVTGSREPITVAIYRSLAFSLGSAYQDEIKPHLVSRMMDKAREALPVTDEKLIEDIIMTSNLVVTDGKGSGLLLIIDELGKFLEFATIHPERQDIYLLQRLAETASRSGNRPIFVVGLLHQGFHEYSYNLSETSQREWEKVASRFEEILFDQPLEQLSTLVASALNLHTNFLPTRNKDDAINEMEKAIKLGWFGASPVNTILLQNAPRFYPLHPTVMPVLTHTFRRFGQNERSLFGFLLSNEPFGLQAFSERAPKPGIFYRLHDFYDYVRCNFGHRLARQSYRSHWNLIDSIIAGYVTKDSLDLKILKTVGILNLLDSNDILPTEKAILSALSPCSGHGTIGKVRESLEKLRSDKRVIYHRGAAGGYCLWPYTSVNLDLAYERATEAVPIVARVTDRLPAYIEPEPIVARRHYIETGNLRHFVIRYSPLVELPGLLEEHSIQADGFIIVPLCETNEDQKTAIQIAKGEIARNRADVIFAVSMPLCDLAGLMTEVERWNWISRNTPELMNDRYAAEEVSRQTQSAQMALERALQTFVGLYQFNEETSLKFFHKGTQFRAESGRELMERLSYICNKLYPDAPKIKNELVNRRSLSSAAAAARIRLIECMLSHSSFERLGMDSKKKPPEMSMYLSVFKFSKMHRTDDTGHWYIDAPPKDADPCCIVPSWNCIRTMLQHQTDRKIRVCDIFAELKRSPYGVRDGLIPIIIAAYIVANQNRTAIYERGTFLPTMEKEEFLRLIKAPDTFDIQDCSVKGVRSEVLGKLLGVISDQNCKPRELDILEVVRPICGFVVGLPEYTKHTKVLSSIAINVRNTVLDARDPVRLLFNDLPQACGYIPIRGDSRQTDIGKNAEKFIRELRSALIELRMAYTQLTERIKSNLEDAFDLRVDEGRSRIELAARAERVLMGVSDPRLKAFCLRISDPNIQDIAWIESIGSFLATSPPTKWRDSDESFFTQELSLVTSLFRRVESMLFEKGKTVEGAESIRITLTRFDGLERNRVVYKEPVDKIAVTTMQEQITQLFKKDPHSAVLAASQVLWEYLSEGNEA